MAGAPTKWYPEINQKIIDFFDVSHTRKNYKKEEVAARFPTLERFAVDNNISTDTIVEWAKEENEGKYPGFSVAYKTAKQIQKDFLIDNAISGRYAQPFSIFLAKNITDMRDQTHQDVTSGGEKLQSVLLVKPEKQVE